MKNFKYAFLFTVLYYKRAILYNGTPLSKIIDKYNIFLYLNVSSVRIFLMITGL